MGDLDIQSMRKPELKAEILKLRAAIRRDRDANGHNLCWWRPELWGVLPESVNIEPTIPPTDEFLQNCAEFRRSLDE